MPDPNLKGDYGGLTGELSFQERQVPAEIIPGLERMLEEYEQQLARQDGKDAETEKLDAEIAEKEIYAEVAQAISKLFEHLKYDVSFDAYLRHTNVGEHDQVLSQQNELEALKREFFKLSEQYDPKQPDDEMAKRLSGLRAEIERRQGWTDTDLIQRDNNRSRQSQEQSELIAELETIKQNLLKNYKQVLDEDLLAQEVIQWIEAQDTWAATLDLQKQTKINFGLKLRQNYFKNIGFVAGQDLEKLKLQRAGMKSLPERIAGLKGAIAEYKKK